MPEKVPGPSVKTRSYQPQPTREDRQDEEPAHVSSRTKPYIKGSKSARKAASKASKAGKAAQKSATKMASVLGKSLPSLPTSLKRPQSGQVASVASAVAAGSSPAPQLLRSSASKSTDDDDDENEVEELHAQAVAEESSLLCAHSDYSLTSSMLGSTAGEESHQDFGCTAERSDRSSDSALSDSGSSSERRSIGRGTESTAGNCSKLAVGNASADVREVAKCSEISWDQKQHQGTRPLQCGSLWDIPTSRNPFPPVSAKAKQERPTKLEMVTLGMRSLPQPTAKLSNVGASGESASLSGGRPTLKPTWTRGRTLVAVCLTITLTAVVLFTGAVSGFFSLGD